MVNLTQGQDWFEGQRPVWESRILPLLSNRNHIRALEVGTWEGGSAVWILQQLCGGDSTKNHLTCIDHFDIFQTVSGRERWARVKENIGHTGFANRVRLITQFSFIGLKILMDELVRTDGPGFDFAYIDGSHRSDDTLLDAEMVWRCTELGGIMVFDDYCWPETDESSILHPKRGIDAFLLVHQDEVEVFHRGYQIMLKKLVPMRQGYLQPTDTIKDIDWDGLHNTIR